MRARCPRRGRIVVPPADLGGNRLPHELGKRLPTRGRCRLPGLELSRRQPNKPGLGAAKTRVIADRREAWLQPSC
jgi:hypothetical protein